ncbi:hypothetical protein PYCC9005_000659 [Savitreella phatthalungensis]
MTGSIAVLQMPIPLDRFHLDTQNNGPFRDFIFPRESNFTSIQRFCDRCMTRIYSFRDDRPKDQISLRGATLDQSTRIVPRFHIMTAEKQPWVVIPEDAESYDDELPEDRRQALADTNTAAKR